AVAQTQQAARVHRIGFVTPFSAGPSIEAFRQGLRHLGYVEGKNLVIESRYADGHFERLPQLFTDLLRLKVDVVVAGSTPGTLAAKQAVTTVPIVFGGVDDPVGSGIVASLARPGGNITGATVGVGGVGFTGKCLGLLKEAVPGLSHVAVLLNPARTLSAQYAGEIQLAARTWKLKVEVLDAGNAADLERAFAAITSSGAQGIFIAPDPFLTESSARIAQFASGKRLPAFHFSRRFAEAGGLLSYGASLDDSYRRAATHVDRILKGAKPADLPVEQPTKFELVINLKTAKAFGLKIPQPLLLRADKVIE
ncbi:MAG TPA: ABC transporter substrate-binding protein, partial [Burkholderiales bacterium]|nr:ABC transporter substrate-binding protein [Burkholderiales bacterium]